jgi:hypothetical protein
LPTDCEHVEVIDDTWMLIDLNETKILTMGKRRVILDGTETLKFPPAEDSRACFDWVESVMSRFCCKHLKHLDRGLLLNDMRRFSSFSRAHVAILVLI